MEVPVSNVLVVDTLDRFFSTPIKWARVRFAASRRSVANDGSWMQKGKVGDEGLEPPTSRV